MKRVFIIAIVAALAAGPAFAGSASIVGSFKSPCYAGAYGIDYHDGYLYHADPLVNPPRIYKTDTTGSLQGTITTHAFTDIDRTNLEFWGVTGRIIRRASTSGSIIRSISAPADGWGITYGEGSLWFTAGSIYRLTVNGSIMGSFRTPFGALGISWDSPCLWYAAYNTPKIYRVTQTGSVIDSFPTSAKSQSVTWDGTYLWYTTALWVYKVSVIYTDVAPASLGRVKALFR